ncbi:MAG: hypothetical protein LBR44_05670 [Clostridiales Family XIII bacterium]|jgi:hypothetical protein|nr:hypothetical protein [Clostridiales Family XIII bacterium]
MSGGHDDCMYLYAQIAEAARFVRNDIVKEPTKTAYGEMMTPHSDALNMVYESVADELERASAMYKSIDWCESGDTGEDSVLMDYWNFGYVKSEEEREAILDRLEELSQESRWYTYDVWRDSGKRIGNHSVHYRGGWSISEVELTYRDDDGKEQTIEYPTWNDYEAAVESIKAQRDTPETVYKLVDGKLKRERVK